MDKVVIHLSFCNGKKVVHSIVLGQNYRLQTSVSVVPIYIFDIEINCSSEMFHQNTFFFILPIPETEMQVCFYPDIRHIDPSLNIIIIKSLVKLTLSLRKTKSHAIKKIGILYT